MRLVSLPTLLSFTLAAGNAAGADLAAVKQRGALRVLVVEGSPRFFAIPDEAPPGLDREILSGFASLQKVRLTVVPVKSWDALIPALVNGEGDIAAGGITVTEGRAKIVAFTSEVFPSREVVVTRKPRKPVTTLETLRTERVGTIKGSSMAAALSEARVPPANIEDNLISGRMEESLKGGRITAIVLGIEDAIVAQQADPELELGLFLGSRKSLAFAVRKDTPELLRALDAHILNVRRTPTWNRLVVKYFGTAALEILQRSQGPE
jgi:ABC-type amino acid transport substrate-binding protein